jgi:hypothetical protein
MALALHPSAQKTRAGDPGIHPSAQKTRAGDPGPGTPAAAQNAGVVGTWDLSVVSDQGTTSSGTVVLKQNGDKIVGTLTAPHGDMPVEASLKEHAITIWFTVPTEDGALGITMNGTVDGDTMKGTLEIAGRDGRREWSAKRAAAATPAPAASDARLDVSGTWAVAVETSAGNGTPTITLKQDGEKVTGHYSGQLGEAPLSGTIKGAAIEFAIDLTVQGTELHIVYTGTAEKTSMRGVVKIGDFADGTFTARKT